MSETFQFTQLRLSSPRDNLRAAIGLIQAEILASDTVLKPDVIFGPEHIVGVGLEVAVAMLTAMADDVDHLTWKDG